MTVPFQYGPAIGNGDGVTQNFSFSFGCPTTPNTGSPLPVLVVLNDGAGNLSTPSFTTTFNNNDPLQGGFVTVTPAPAVGKFVTIWRDFSSAYVQATDLTNTGGFYPATVEGMLDYLTFQTQELLEITGRCLQVPFGVQPSQVPTPASWVTLLTNAVLGFAPFYKFSAATGADPTSTFGGIWVDGSERMTFSMFSHKLFRMAPGSFGSDVNYLGTVGATTGNRPYFQSLGSDTNVSMGYDAQGTGSHIFSNSALTKILQLNGGASNVNYWTLGNSGAGTVPFLSAVGGDTNVFAGYGAQGAGGHLFYVNGVNQFQIGYTASAVNQLIATGGAAGSPPTLQAIGTDTNIDLYLNCKGTGNIKTNSIVANGVVATALSSLGPTGSHTTVQEWLAVKNSAGTVRYIPLF